MRSRGIARHGHTIHRTASTGTGLGERVGQVTSGTTSPTLGKPIALGYVPTELSEPGSRVVIDVRGKPVVILSGRAAERAQELGLTEWAISLSHEREYAIAVVVAR